MLKDFGKTCPANPFCDLIECYLSWERISNINCFPRMGLILIFALFFIGSISLYYVLTIIKLTYWLMTVILRFTIRLAKALFRIAKWIKSKIEKRFGHRNIGRHIRPFGNRTLSPFCSVERLLDKLIHIYLWPDDLDQISKKTKKTSAINAIKIHVNALQPRVSMNLNRKKTCIFPHDRDSTHVTLIMMMSTILFWMKQLHPFHQPFHESLHDTSQEQRLSLQLILHHKPKQVGLYTIDGFQGQESPIMILSLVHSRPRLLSRPPIARNPHHQQIPIQSVSSTMNFRSKSRHPDKEMECSLSEM